MTDGLLPLSGIRVLELGSGAAAPLAGRYLAEHGAEVIRVESPTKPEVIRQFSAAWLPADTPKVVRLDTGPMWSEFNAGKLSLGLDVGQPRGLEMLRGLLTHADVLLSNLSAPVLPALGLGYDEVAAIRPDIVYCSLPSFGNTPSSYYRYRTYGPNQSPLASLDHLTGWPDRAPSGIGGFSYPDFLSAVQAAYAIVAAVLHRDVSGQGQMIDISQFEATVAAIGPVLLDCAANGNVQSGTGNRGGTCAPEGIYPARGTDQWIAVSCRTPEQWASLVEVAAGEPFTDAPRFDTADGRVEHADELDRLLADWTRRYTARDLAYRLQSAGVPAGMVQDGADLLVDPQLESRGFFQYRTHARFGQDLVAGYPARFSDTPLESRRGAPCLGEHTEQVLRDVAGLDDEQIAELVDAGIAFPLAEPDHTLSRPYLRWAKHFVSALDPRAGR